MSEPAVPAGVLTEKGELHTARSTPADATDGLAMQRFFTRSGEHPYDAVKWEHRHAVITGENGRVVFEQRDVEFPESWSQLAANVVASKYFRGPLDSPRRERSVRQVLDRVVHTITRWGDGDGYFAGKEDADIFAAELTHVLLHQKASFNSPVWFNIGVENTPPQASACFIISVDDDMHRILDWYRQEGVIFKGGSGSGVNLSRLRATGEPLSGGGTASGPLSFMRAADASAGAIKSGGTTRRSAKMVLLDADHPDVEAFIRCKAVEEKKAHALIDAGYDASLDGDAYGTVSFQNANNSVRVSDAFMRAVAEDGEWHTRYRMSGQPAKTYQARDLMRHIAEATWACGDPGIQFDDTINSWHTCPAAGRQEATNPCSEYCWINDSACNLASLNLMQFLDDSGNFDVEGFRHAVHVMILAQEILVGHASYPTEAIEKNSHDFRTLGLGYANIGAMLMALGLPYDSDAGRAYAGTVTALMTGQAYLTSSLIAAAQGTFAGYPANREAMLRVIARHQESCAGTQHESLPRGLHDAAQRVWKDCYAHGREFGYRNAQVTLLAPTGTIAFMMDCDTTGIEPDLALVKYKKLVGGGGLKIVNNTVPRALARLGYTPQQIDDVVRHVDEHGAVEGAPGFKEEHLPVFDCAFPAGPEGRSIHYSGHLRMVAAVQPFLSGAISKTINVPNQATVADIEQAYIDAWNLGIKCVAIYRDGCKRTQPLSTKAADTENEAVQQRPMRRRLPDTRHSLTHKFSIAGHEGYITVGMFEDGAPGEIFLVMSKEGSTISGLMDAFATSISLAFQYGVPLRALIDKFSHMRFEPAGFTKNSEIPIAKSVMDYIFRWLASKFLDQDERAQIGVIDRDGMEQAAEPVTPKEAANGHHKPLAAPDEPYYFRLQDDAPPCTECGSLMIRNGACYKCPNCGATSGCS